MLGGQGWEQLALSSEYFSNVSSLPASAKLRPELNQEHVSQVITKDQEESRPREARPEDSSIYIYIYNEYAISCDINLCTIILYQII